MSRSILNFGAGPPMLPAAIMLQAQLNSWIGKARANQSSY